MKDRKIIPGADFVTELVILAEKAREGNLIPKGNTLALLHRAQRGKVVISKKKSVRLVCHENAVIRVPQIMPHS